jgi:hypothetical protein
VCCKLNYLENSFSSLTLCLHLLVKRRLKLILAVLDCLAGESDRKEAVKVCNCLPEHKHKLKLWYECYPC